MKVDFLFFIFEGIQKRKCFERLKEFFRYRNHNFILLIIINKILIMFEFLKALIYLSLKKELNDVMENLQIETVGKNHKFVS